MSKDTVENKEDYEFETEIDNEIKRRPRSPTLLKLKMFAERFRKKNEVREKLKSGKYDMSSERIAKAILNDEEEQKENE